MKLVAIGMVKDEEDVIERTLWHVAGQGADAIVLYDNGSTDETRAILNRLSESGLGATSLEVYTDWEVAYYQSRKMTELAEYAGVAKRADWVWPFDADELWTWPAGTVRDALSEARHDVVSATLVNHYETALDPPAGHPFDRMAWRAKKPLGLPKVVFRWREGAVVAPGNHAVYGSLARKSPVDVGLIVHHYPYRGAEHFIRKARNGGRAYAASDLGEDTGRHWRDYGRLVEEHGEEAAASFYREHFTYADPEEADLVLDSAGWPDTLPA